MSKQINNDCLLLSRASIVVDNAWNARDEIGDIRTLVSSIRKNGVLQPVIVARLAEPSETGETHTLIAGFRRIAALDALKSQHVPVTVRDTDEQGARVANLVENVQREDLTTAELATALSQLSSDIGETSSKIAARVGLSKSHVGNLIRIKTKACGEVWEAFASEKISMNQALKAVGAGENEVDQIEALHKELGLFEEEESEESEDGDGLGKKITAQKARPNAKKLAEYCQAAREMAKGNYPLPRGKKWDASTLKLVAGVLAWACGQSQKPPFGLPNIDTDHENENE